MKRIHSSLVRHASVCSRRTAHESAVHQGIRTEGTEDDLGAASRGWCGRQALPGCAGGERWSLESRKDTFVRTAAWAEYGSQIQTKRRHVQLR